MTVRSTAALAALLFVALFAAPPSGAQEYGRYNGSCRKLTRQISNFHDTADLARERGNELWLASTVAHIERLRDRRSRLCPEYDTLTARLRNEEFWRETYALTMTGAKAAMSYFTFGMY